jgi:H+-translocating NAD(P) transhydrogenase subunit beta
MRESLLSLSYLIASILFILCLRGLSSPENGKKGVVYGEVGMLIAVVATLLDAKIVSYGWIAAGLMLGSTVGVAISLRIPMTKMPERIALSHAFGGLATALVGISEFYNHQHAHLEPLNAFTTSALAFEVFLGSLTFTGSLMAFGKLQGIIGGTPITFPGINLVNIAMFIGALLVTIALGVMPSAPHELFYGLSVMGLIVGITGVLPIGGADMPVVISLMNSYAGLAAAATGFALNQPILIIAGALDGSSGFLLSMMMSKAMNRSFSNVLFGAFGTGGGTAATGTATGGAQRSYNEASLEDAVAVLKASESVIVVPGYGMAVSQAQHAVRDLAAALAKQGTDVKYAIHPVAGRMPGHMNVLLAEANVPYDALFDLDMINDDFSRTDAVLIVGANDVVNPAAKTDPKSPIYGMPVFNVDQARSVIALKRSMNTGFSGIENELFFAPNTMMVLGDAKKTILALCSGLKGDGGH